MSINNEDKQKLLNWLSCVNNDVNLMKTLLIEDNFENAIELLKQTKFGFDIIVNSLIGLDAHGYEKEYVPQAAMDISKFDNYRLGKEFGSKMMVLIDIVDGEQLDPFAIFEYMGMNFYEVYIKSLMNTYGWKHKLLDFIKGIIESADIYDMTIDAGEPYIEKNI